MLVIVNYGIGNLNSILNMLRKTGAECIISSEITEINHADKLLLPGMGHFDNCMIRFTQSGLKQVIEKRVLEDRIPVLGICVGLQMLMASSEEGSEPGLSWIKGRTVRFKPELMQTSPKIPNMGWLETQPAKVSPLFHELDQARFYFAHSYHVQVDNNEDILATAHYGYNFTVGIEKDNILGVQFHPEKSHRFGMQLLKNFSENY